MAHVRLHSLVSLLVLLLVLSACRAEPDGAQEGAAAAAADSPAPPAICSQSPLPRILYPHRHPLNGTTPPKQIPPHLLAVAAQPQSPPASARRPLSLFPLLTCLPPLLSVSSAVCQYYTRCGSIPTAEMYVDDSYSGAGSHYKFPRDHIDRLQSQALKIIEKLPHRPAPKKLQALFSALTDDRVRPMLPGASVLVVGSQDPWHEAVALALGAKQVVTVEYNNLTYAHPALLTTTPAAFAAAIAGGPSSYTGPTSFDLVLALAAVDHDGLGRYNDPLAPDGDLLTMDAMKAWLKTSEQRLQERTGPRPGDARGLKPAREVPGGGLLILGVPIGPDVLVWNLERIYGNRRLPLLLDGWKIIARFGWLEERLTQQSDYRHRYEPIFLLSPEGETAADEQPEPIADGDRRRGRRGAPLPPRAAGSRQQPQQMGSNRDRRPPRAQRGKRHRPIHDEL